MEFQIEKWTVEKIIRLYEDNKLNLNPPYQRNEIWPVKHKQRLIDSIKNNYPIPNFFLYMKKDGIFDIVDGQQRTRAILGYYKKQFPDLKKAEYDPDKFPEFLKYILSVTIITNIKTDEKMEQFYSLVNSTGLKLNRPELNKAQYYDTRFLSLIDILSTNEKFQSFQLFPESSLRRMTDADFMGELVCQMKYGITDKKIYVDKMFEEDITEAEYDKFFERFERIVDILDHLNEIFPLKETRYKQRNDFYTLFGFINQSLDLEIQIFEYFYKLLVLVGEDIAPSTEDCEPFKEYALHCVSQSNSKNARLKRLDFFNGFLLNTDPKPNEIQESILKFYEVNEDELEKLGAYTIISFKRLQSIVKEPNIEKDNSMEVLNEDH